MNAAQVPVGAALNLVNGLFNNNLLQLYAGTQPATPETALSGNTLLVTFQFSNPAFAVSSFSTPNEQAVATFVSNSVNPGATNTVVFARAVAATWTATTAYVLGQAAVNSGNMYQCIAAGTSAGSGGPTTTALSITDGSVTWKYLGAAATATLADYTVGTSGQDIVIGNTGLQTGVNVSITSFTHKMPAV